MLSVRFEHPDGRTVSGATVGISRGPGEFPDIAAHTDADGRATFDVTLPGRYEFFALVGGTAYRAVGDFTEGESALAVVIR